jgi:type II secretory pathway pseudopilin PulG
MAEFGWAIVGIGSAALAAAITLFLQKTRQKRRDLFHLYYRLAGEQVGRVALAFIDGNDAALRQLVDQIRGEGNWNDRAFVFQRLAELIPQSALAATAEPESTPSGKPTRDPTSDPLLCLLCGCQLCHEALSLRGLERFEELVARKKEAYDALLTKADDLLSQATELDERDPTPLAFRLLIAGERGMQEAPVWALFAQITELEKHHLLAHYAMVRYFARNCGNYDEMFRFVRDAVSHSPPGSSINGLLVVAHVERWARDARQNDDLDSAARYLADPSNQQDVLAAFCRFRARPNDDFDVVITENYFAFWLYLIGDKARLRDFESLLRSRPTPLPWAFTGRSPDVAANRAADYATRP